MKKCFAGLLIAIVAIVLVPTKSFAVDTIPNTSVWFTPANAAAGTAITLNALVYNNQGKDATVTVQFKTAAASGTTASQASIIGTQTQLITAQSAKTVMQPWIMPKTATVVTVSVTAAVDSNKKSIPALIGTLGTVSVGAGVIPAMNSSGIPGTSQLTAWLGPLFSTIETFRVNQAAAYATLRDQTKATLGITPSAITPSTGDGLPPLKFDNPIQYLILVYATAMASFFGTAAIFYIGAVLIVLLVIRFLVNLIF
jgi:hypothetical protein